jgi:DNA-binding PadR family transcriptional regulator
MTVPVQAVLRALLHQPNAERHGLAIVNASGVDAGRIYPVLRRLHDAGWVSDRWEDPEVAHVEGRPPRRYYRLTVEGHARAVRALVHGLQRDGDRSGPSRLLHPRTARTPR